MLPTLRASLPYTLALAVLAYFAFAFFTLEINQAWFVVIGVLLAGILVPVLVDVKGAAVPSSAVSPEFNGDTVPAGAAPLSADEVAEARANVLADPLRQLFRGNRPAWRFAKQRSIAIAANPAHQRRACLAALLLQFVLAISQ